MIGTDERIFGTPLPVTLIDRIRHEALRRGVPIKRLVSEVMDAALPKRLHVAVDEPASPRRGKAG